MSAVVPFARGFPSDWPIRPANYLQLDWRAHTRNMIHLWLPESVNPGGAVPQALFILNEEVSFQFKRIAPDHWQHTFEKPGTVRLRGECRAIADGVELGLEVTNLSGTTWPNLTTGVCVQLIAAPDFADRQLERTFTVADGKLHRVAQPTQRGGIVEFYQPAVPATDNFIAVESQPPGFVIAQWWDGPPLSVGGNCHGSIACIHAPPSFGALPAGVTARRRGRLYLMPGTVEDAHHRCQT